MGYPGDLPVNDSRDLKAETFLFSKDAAYGVG